MRAFRSLSVLAFSTAIALASRESAAQVRTFSANSIIVPMGTVNQGVAGIAGGVGLVYWLVQKGFTVYSIIDPAKTSLTGIDFSITVSAGKPVGLYDWATGGTVTTGIPDGTIQYMGGPFVIDAADHDRLLYLLQNDPTFGATTVYRTAPVRLHVANQSFTAPVKATVNGPFPKFALIALASSLDSSFDKYLDDAGINFSGTYGTSSGLVYDRFEQCGDLTSTAWTTAYGMLWASKWGGSGCSAPEKATVFANLSNFLDAGNVYFAESDSIVTGEETTNGNFMVDTAAPNNLDTNGVAAGTYPSQFADFSSPYVQVADLTPDNAGSGVRNWTIKGARTWKPGVVHLWQMQKTAADPWYDWESFRFKDNDPAKGRILYFGGNNYNAKPAGERLILNNLFFGLASTSATRPRELSRSAPIVYSDGKTYQGTYLNQAMAASAYPPVVGHFREYPAGALNGAQVLGFEKATASWDAANLVPSGAARTVFTAVKVGAKLTSINFVAANAASLASPMGLSVAAAPAKIDLIRSGPLGGIDHSTPAVVGPSAIAGSASRPTVAYVGGLDGMLHAIAISGGGVTPGTELWAFIPPSQLGKIATYQAGVDGSPQVADAFAEDGSGVRAWRTLIAVTNGLFGGTVAVLEVTDPLAPKFLWEASTPSGSYAMGTASGAAFGNVVLAAAPTSLVFVATNNAGSAGNGFNLYAIDAGNGAIAWQWNHLYQRTIPGTTTIVPNEIPGVPAVINSTGDGGLDNRVYLGDLDGKVWEIDARFSAGGPTSPLYDAGTTGQPIGASVTLYRDRATGHLAVLGATGGQDWVPSSTIPFVFAVDTVARVGGSTGPGVQIFKTALALGERIYATPTIAGNDVYIITSFGSFAGNISASTDDAGNIRRLNLTAGTIAMTSAVKKGAGEVAVVADGTVIGASAGGETSLANGGRDKEGVVLDDKPKRPITVQAWLDLR